MDMGPISAGISAARTLKDMAQGLSELKTQGQIESAILDMKRMASDALTGALEAKTALLEMQLAGEESRRRIQSLEHELEDMKSKAAKLDKYQLHTFQGGLLAYKEKDAEQGQPAIFMCVSCFQQGKLSILMPRNQSQDYTAKYQNYWCCDQTCKAQVWEVIGPGKAPPQRQTRSNSWI